MSEKLILTFTVELNHPYENLFSKSSLQEEYHNDLFRAVSELYEQEGQFWSEELKLIQVSIIDLKQYAGEDNEV